MDLRELIMAETRRLGLSDYALAQDSGVSHAVISRWFRGVRMQVTVGTVEKLLAALDFKVEARK